jgi:hypothetical protein
MWWQDERQFQAGVARVRAAVEAHTKWVHAEKLSGSLVPQRLHLPAVSSEWKDHDIRHFLVEVPPMGAREAYSAVKGGDAVHQTEATGAASAREAADCVGCGDKFSFDLDTSWRCLGCRRFRCDECREDFPKQVCDELCEKDYTSSLLTQAGPQS